MYKTFTPYGVATYYPKLKLFTHSLPAIEAVMKQESVAATKARKASCERTVLLLGSMADKAPMMTPMEPKLAKPQSA